METTSPQFSCLREKPRHPNFLVFVRRYANLYFVWLVAILWVFFATVGYDLYSWALLLCPYFAAFDCLSNFKDGASELYRPPSGKKNHVTPNFDRVTMEDHITIKITTAPQCQPILHPKFARRYHVTIQNGHRTTTAATL